MSNKTDSVSYREAICDPKYCYPLYICVAWVVFITMNGSQPLGYYGQVILKDLQSNSDDKYSVNQIQDLSLIAQAAAQFSSVFIVNLQPRKSFMIAYCLFLGVLNLLIATYSLVGNNLGVFLTALCMFFVQDCFGMTIVGLYTIEIT